MRLALIPARGGSKRIPRKNIKAFHGKPIIAYSIETALSSGLFDEVIVSTDDQEIAEVAKQYGASVPFIRPADLSDDHATTVEVIKHAINDFKNKGLEIDQVCCIYATAPFVQKDFLVEGFEAIEKKGFSLAFAATEFSFPIQRALRRLENGGVEMLQPEHLVTRSQDLEPAYHDAGQFYWGKAQAFLDDIPIFSEQSYAVNLPHYLVQDIDTPADWIRAELLFKALEQNLEDSH